jgi:endonuclease YncB( thermonuclease family)
MNAWEFDSLLWRYRAREARIIDGDTLSLVVDCGFSARFEAVIRLAGVWAPELREPGGREAHRALSALVAMGSGSWPMRLETTRLALGGETRSFSRYVGRVWVNWADGSLHDVGEAMVREGYASAGRGVE